MRDYSRLKPFTNNVQSWDSFVEAMNSELEYIRDLLETTEDEKRMFFLQGRIRQIRDCLKFREWSNAKEAKR